MTSRSCPSTDRAAAAPPRRQGQYGGLAPTFHAPDPRPPMASASRQEGVRHEREDPRLRCLALRQRQPAPRPRRRAPTCRPTSSPATTACAATRCSMVSGSDTHGTPITVRAEKEGVSPREVVDRFHASFLQLAAGLRHHLRPLHRDGHREPLARDAGHVPAPAGERLHLQGHDGQPLLPVVPALPADRYVEGTCPHCGFADARGDQCDNCGHTLDAIELMHPRCKFCGATPEPRETEHFFLDLGKLNGPLLEWINQDKEHWRPNVVNFTRNMLESGELHGRPDHPRHRLGHPGAAARLRGQAHLRLVRRRHRLPLGHAGVGPDQRRSRRPGGSGGRTEPVRTTTSSARTTSPSTPSSGRRCCWATAA